MSGLVASVFPRLKTIKLDQSSLSRDTNTAERISSDPLHYMGGVRARTGAEVLLATADVQKQLDNLTFPMLILHGGADTLTKPEASELLYAESTSTDKTLKIYPGAYHELFNEPNKEEVFADMYSWMQHRM